MLHEVQLDGLVGPTHNYGGLSPGNTASLKHGGKPSNPKAAALQGLAKMRFVRGLGVLQGVLPPHPRPRLSALRRLGFNGRDEDVIARAAADDGLWLRLASSAASMWAANAATVAPSCDARDGRVHFVPANLAAMWHRALEADTTRDVLRAIFADEARFVVHDPLPGAHLADEGAANHTRLWVAGRPAVHVFAWGRAAFGEAGAPAPQRYPARQTREASRALARLLEVEHLAVFPQQHQDGIDGGAFHTDVVAVGDGDLLLLHELAFSDRDALIAELQRRLDGRLRVVLAASDELPLDDAVTAYPFNSQLLTIDGGHQVIVAPEESRANPAAARYLARVVAADVGVTAVHHLDLRESMENGGGPACLRLRVPLTDDERGALSARVLVDDALLADLGAWVERRYRDRLAPADLADPALARESMAALDELTGLLRLGSVYDFQRAGA